MVYAAILAGGSGSRMKSDTPKQYMLIDKKPIFIYSIEAFASHPGVDRILLAVHENYYEHAKKQVKKYCPKISLSIILGGESRLDTLKNIIYHLELTNNIEPDTVLISHDAARPFIDSKIIYKNIEAALKHGACNTVIPATDTIIESKDGEFISASPLRKHLFQVQTPQSFLAEELLRHTKSLTEYEEKDLTDACSIFTLRNKPVKLVEGRPENIKITYPQDLIFAEKYAQKLRKN